MFLSQTVNPTRGDILDPPNSFSHCFVEGYGGHHTFHQTTGQFETLLGRQLKCHPCEICRNHKRILRDSGLKTSEVTEI